VRKGRGQKFLAILRRALRELSEAPEVTSTDVQFSGQNRDQRQAGPLPKTKIGEQLLSGVLDRRLDAIDGGQGHGALSLTGAE
jgi:hypothetical protein